MKDRKGFTLIELLVVIAIIAVLAAILFPVFAKARAAAKASNCQSNMTQIGRAMKMYLSDWDDTYPTNRTRSGMLIQSVVLSPYNPTDPKRFVNGTNWVEALFNYIESTSSQKDPMSVWRCQAASSSPMVPGSQTANVTYIMNYNMLEQPEGVIKAAANLMLVREFDRLMESVCRPMNLSYNSSQQPQSPFMGETDQGFRGAKFNNKLHNKGSHILFCDGHVKYFGTEYFPQAQTLSVSDSWDPETNQWWNWVNKDPALNKAVAVTP